LVKTGLFPKEASAEIHKLFEARNEDDYERLEEIPDEEVASSLTQAESFIARAREYLTRGGFLDSSIIQDRQR